MSTSMSVKSKAGTWKNLVASRLLRIFLIRCTLSNISYVYFSGLNGFVIALSRIEHGYSFLWCLYALTLVEWLSQTTALIVKFTLVSIDTQLRIPS